MSQISRAWRKISRVYRVFASEPPARYELDFSEQAALECFEWESSGLHKDKYSSNVFTAQGTVNGFVLGKKLADQTVEMWRGNPSKPYPFCYGDIQRGRLTVLELYEDPVFRQHWSWLDKVLRGLPKFDTNVLSAILAPHAVVKQQIGAA